LAELRVAGSLISLIEQRQATAAPGMLNIERVRACLSGCDPVDFVRLTDLATHGARIIPPMGFVRQSVPNSMRSIAGRLGKCFEKHAHKLWSEGKVLILPLEEIESYDCPQLNFSGDMWWVGNQGKPQGRILIDATHTTGDGCVMNTPDVKEAITNLYGDLKLPLAQRILADTVAYCEENNVSLMDMVLSKYDVVGAFGQQFVHPADAPLLAIRLTEALIMVHMFGQFGPLGQPQTYGVLMRSTEACLRLLVSALVNTYLDDYILIMHRLVAASEHLKTGQFLRDVLGNAAINDKKTVEPSPEGEILGWFVSFPSKSVRPNDRGIRILAAVFFAVDITTPGVRWSLHLVQVLSSLTERYSLAIIGMRVFVDQFTNLQRGTVQSSDRFNLSRRTVSSMAKLAVVFWRAVILIMISDPSYLAVPIEYFARDILSESYSYSVVTDAADSVGLLLFEGADLIAYTSYAFPFYAHEGKFQNAREFLGIVLALILFKRQFNLPRGSKIALRSDNMSALSWVKKNKTTSELAHFAFIAYSYVVIITGYEVVDLTHIAGKSDEMFNSDALSRNRPTRDLDSSLFVVTSGITKLDALFALLDPSGDTPILSTHLTLFDKVVRLVTSALEL